MTAGLRQHLTFKGNLKRARYGWLRLTPAYSVHMVSDLLDRYAEPGGAVLDPFCGTGTTALACAEKGLVCDTTDINPFLLWLARTKTRPYDTSDIHSFDLASAEIARSIRSEPGAQPWVPALHQIEKWWNSRVLEILGHILAQVAAREEQQRSQVVDLLKVAFCRTMIEQANVSFGHQSMSFKKGGAEQLRLFHTVEDAVEEVWRHSTSLIAAAAKSPIAKQPRAILCDARALSSCLPENRYSCVVTSPPYPNRMSYIRELRPYMYWLRFLENGRDAGELDWQAIGGTWGCATSNVGKWKPELELQIPYQRFSEILQSIEAHSSLLSRYVHKYFHDIVLHCNELFRVVRSGGTVHYIVGNSKFYEMLLPVEEIYASLFEASGFEQVSINVIRKRTSKKELYEFLVSARKPC